MRPRAFPPPPGWSLDGHRIKAPLDYDRGPDRTWVYGALRVQDGQAVTLTAPARNAACYLALLEATAEANPVSDLYLITDNLASHKSPPIQGWLAANPRVRQVFLPTGCRGGKIGPCSARVLVDMMQAAENGPRVDWVSRRTNGGPGCI